MAVTVGDIDTPSAFLSLLAERAAIDPAFLGSVVQLYAQAEGRSHAHVLAELGVAESSATDFLVSLRPTGERFAEMLRAICIRFGANENRLLGVLRQVEVLEAFAGGDQSASASGSTDAGLLMAARMKDDPRTRGDTGKSESHGHDVDGDDGGSGAR
jgi:hypothetical protein